VTFILLFGLGASWAMLTPLFGGPDENEHVVRAWGIAEGQLNGQPRRPGSELRAFMVPEALRRYQGFPCWGGGGLVGEPKLPTCIPDFSSSPKRVLVTSRAAEYPPVYYIVASAPALLDAERPVTVYAMRLLTAAIAAALIASAFVSAIDTGVPAIAGAGLLLALTPLALSLFGVVNPNSPEIAASVLLWTAGCLAVLGAATAVDERLVTRAGVAATVLALSRPISPLWLGLIVVAVAALGNRASLRALARSTRVRVWGAIAAAASAFQLGWLSIYGQYTIPQGFQDLPVTAAVRTSLGRQEALFRDIIGRLHWGMFTPSGPAVILWLAAVGALVVVAALVTRPRTTVVILGVAVACVAVPVFIEVVGAEEQGIFFWRARYTLPLAVGVPILAGLALASRAEIDSRLLRRLAIILGAVFLVGSWIAFARDAQLLHVGIYGPLLPWSGNGWSPPVPLTLLDAVYLVLLAALVVLTVKPVTEAAAPWSVRPQGGVGALRESP
jgi:hypothetical protein